MIESGLKSEVVDWMCEGQAWVNVWYVLDMVILITGVLANAALLWLFLMERKSLSASKVLGLNLVVMDLIFLCTVPVNFINRDLSVIQNRSGYNPHFPDSFSSNQLDKTAGVCSMFNLMGCPLLLTCMCVERYLAVMRPVLYLRVRKWEYRVAISATVWAITLVFVVARICLPDKTIILAAVSIIISCLCILMLLCLGSVIWSLRQQSPALSTHGKQRCTESRLKKQAVRNVLIVVVPAVMSYLPVLMMSPLLLLINYTDYSFDERMCSVFELSFLFPRLGVFIGPLFYFSKAKQMCCLKGARNKCNEPDN
ncbi:G-protein coupled receptor 4 [Pleuronectes platessa]|uniref:G-protein coupled receptor 4 n=1 Tax=Pleuronectes platessa TaxID=8262 RepID=UPI00232A77A4|nr:G-protein coupled receptor 4 [Pleuronectes platessa]XP_053270734.1 G-protein coupled receptor 4 [Pleuronectes platessa]